MSGQDPIMYDYQTLQTAFQTVKQFGAQVEKLGNTLTKVHNSLEEHCSGDESGIGAVIAGAAKDVTGVAGKVFSEGGRVLAEMGERGKTNGQRAQNTDQTIADAFDGINDDAGGGQNGSGPRSAGSDPASPGTGTSGTTGPVEEPFGTGGTGGQQNDGNSGTNKGGDPVDVVSGQVVTSALDLVLPGILPLVLRRAYASGYRHGRHFGPGWSSTLDQRIVIDGDGIHYLGDDAQCLDYPVPTQPGQQVMPAAGARWPLTWDRKSGLIVIANTDHHTLLHFSAAMGTGGSGRETRFLSRIEDRHGNWIQFQRDQDQVATDVYRRGGQHLAIDSGSVRGAPRIEGIRLLDGTGRGIDVVRFGYDIYGRLTEITDSTGVAYVYEYDDADRINAWLDRLGFRYEYTYDEDGRAVRGCGPDGYLSAEFDYDLVNRVTTVTNSLGHRTEYHYDERARVVNVVDPLGRTTASERDKYGRIVSTTDPLGRTETFVRDPQGRILTATRPDGATVLAEFGHAQATGPTRVTDPNGAVWQCAYDVVGNLLSTTDPHGAVTSYTYDEFGALASLTDPTGAAYAFESDGTGTLTASRDALGSRVVFERDAFGRVAAITDALGGVTRLVWSVEGRPLAQTYPDGTREEFCHDAHGNMVEHVDTLGRSTRFEYGPFARRTAKILPDGSRYEFTYDTELRVTAVTGPTGAVWRYEYDAAGGLIGEIDFSGREIRYELDQTGRLSKRTNGAGQVVSFDRDAAGRVIARRTEQGAATTFRFDAAGRLMRAEGTGSVLEYHRDGVGRILSESCDQGVLLHEYDAAGRRLRRTTVSGALSEWAYDLAGRAAALETPAGGIIFHYDALGRETGRVIGTTAISQSWDEAGRLAGQALWHVAEGGTDYQLTTSRTYRWAADGALDGIDDQQFGQRRYELDIARRVVAVHASTWNERYAYDTLGNLVSANETATATAPEGDAATPDYEYAAGRIRRAGRTTYEYDGQGRRTKVRRRTISGQVREWTYQWDADDRLTRLIEPDGATWIYDYDPIGRRIAKRRMTADGQAAQSTRFTWDGTRLAEQTRVEADGTRVILTWDYEPGTHRAATQLRRRLRPAANEPETGDTDETALLAVVADPVGTPTELVASDGTIAWRSGLTLWGEQRGETLESDACPLRFPGQYHDPETGWHYNYFRHYDPQTAQYTGPDPLGLEPAPNPYAYVGNPLTGIDPLGLAESASLGGRPNPYPDRESAYQAARQLAGVPKGTAPDLTWQVTGDVTKRGIDGYFWSPDQAHWGNFEQYEIPGVGSRVVVEHTDDPAGSHFHAGQPKGNPSRRDVDFGWGSTRPTDTGFERYGKINRPGTDDHHLFYNGGKMPVKSEGYGGE